jgi:hypothetical protein
LGLEVVGLVGGESMEEVGDTNIVDHRIGEKRYLKINSYDVWFFMIFTYWYYYLC